MPATLVNPQTKIMPGVYLSDGVHLYYVLRVHTALATPKTPVHLRVSVEDCSSSDRYIFTLEEVTKDPWCVITPESPNIERGAD